MVGKKFSSLNRDAFELKMRKICICLYLLSIFNKCISGELDNKHQKKQLDDMLNYLKQIHDGTRTKDEVEKEFGQKLADKYVNPIVENLEKK